MMIQQDFGSIYNNDYLPRSEAAVLGAKNLLYTSLDKIKAINVGGTWTNNTYVYNGVTYVFNDDGTVTVSGTTSSSASYLNVINMLPSDFNAKYNLDLRLSGCPEGGGENKYGAILFEDGNFSNLLYDYGDGVTKPKDWFSSATGHIYLRLYIYPNYAIQSSIIFKPMFRLASDLDSSYAPPAMTNRELSEKININDTWHQVSGHNIYYTKKYGIVTISVFDTITSNTNVNLTNVIPQDYRPSKDLQFPAVGPNVTDSGIVIVSTNGNMLLYIQGSGATSTIRTTITYVV